MLKPAEGKCNKTFTTCVVTTSFSFFQLFLFLVYCTPNTSAKSTYISDTISPRSFHSFKLYCYKWIIAIVPINRDVVTNVNHSNINEYLLHLFFYVLILHSIKDSTGLSTSQNLYYCYVRPRMEWENNSQPSKSAVIKLPTQPRWGDLGPI